MDNSAPKRWAVLLSVLAATIAAVCYPVDEPAFPTASATPKAQLAAVVPAPMATEESEGEQQGDPNPFSPRGWQAPPPAPLPATPVVVAPVFVGPPAPPPPPVAPPLPFRFMGALIDGAEQTVYLARGDEAFVAHLGDVLDGTYKVGSIHANQIEFEHIPTHQKQTLAFPTHDK